MPWPGASLGQMIFFRLPRNQKASRLFSDREGRAGYEISRIRVVFTQKEFPCKLQKERINAGKRTKSR